MVSPLEAYEYVVNGRSAIGWLMDRYQFARTRRRHRQRPFNDFSDDRAYIVVIWLSVVTVSMETHRYR